MANYQFDFQGKNYQLTEGLCTSLLNNEEKPVQGISVRELLQLLQDHQGVQFDMEYYDQPCVHCGTGKKEKTTAFPFLEYHFFLYTKNDQYVISSLSKEYENSSLNQLLNTGIVDNSFIVMITVCPHCSAYDIEISQCEV
ncbi:DUF3785 family protein [Dehalobacterium formicoaceticum]|uniref:DUF3785 domain-containing protein n=1 Tax=Dehalobacterium formicoaceticum TaxID=51515 RepID=A0ABT1Y3X1_9FIRM|nr:DUF3785 family protein [Dehalobacterium formicoaceticum]MCR6545191.1 DUF3785 domain-containing protein [Dehalobacterium formicoaceticum]